MTVNELATLAHPVIDRLTGENDHQAAILLKEAIERLQDLDSAARAKTNFVPMGFKNGPGEITQIS